MADWPSSPKDIKRPRRWSRRRDIQVARLHGLEGLQRDLSQDEAALQCFKAELAIRYPVEGVIGMQSKINAEITKAQDWVARPRKG